MTNIIAPSAVTAIVAFIVGFQSLLGWNFLPEQWTAFVMVAAAIIVYFRQIVTGRSGWFGGRS